ncbi:MAG: D-alanine--D-alanine ligase [Bacteroidales bacterium]|nr:D-alanine--D-alanine ligase [Bacteroidales bacterium]
MKKNIAVVVGGFSPEAVISVQSGELVAKNLDRNLYEVYIVSVSKNGWIVQSDLVCDVPVNKADFSFSFNNQKIKFDFAFILIHGHPGENGVLQGYFDMIGIPYSTAGVRTSVLTFDKYQSKLFLKQFGVVSAKSLFLNPKSRVLPEDIVAELDLPCFVKPNASGSSFGVSKVKNKKILKAAINEAFTKDSHGVIVEEFIEGTEVSCGVFKIKKEAFVFPPTEIVTENDFFDYEAKYIGSKTQEITPARLPDEIIRKVQDASSQIYDLFQCKGIVRVDFIIKDDIPYFIEINTVPGMSEKSLFPQQAKVKGMEMQDILTMVISDIID